MSNPGGYYPQYPEPQYSDPRYRPGETAWQPNQYAQPYADPYAPQYDAYAPTDQFASYGQTYQQPLPVPTQAGPNTYPAGPGYPVAQKSKVTAALLAFFLGGFGIHNFYLGNTTRGIVQLSMWLVGWATSFILVGFFLLGPLSIWVLVEFIMLLSGSGSYAYDARGIPLKG